MEEEEECASAASDDDREWQQNASLQCGAAAIRWASCKPPFLFLLKPCLAKRCMQLACAGIACLCRHRSYAQVLLACAGTALSRRDCLLAGAPFLHAGVTCLLRHCSCAQALLACTYIALTHRQCLLAQALLMCAGTASFTCTRVFRRGSRHVQARQRAAGRAHDAAALAYAGIYLSRPANMACCCPPLGMMGVCASGKQAGQWRPTAGRC